MYSDDYQSFIPRGQNGKRMDILNKEKMEENAFECVMPMDKLLHTHDPVIFRHVVLIFSCSDHHGWIIHLVKRVL